MTTLGFNLIVKNEENCLAKTLSNIQPIADEIVITDTGSTDNTVAIAKQFTDAVYFHEWQDSFSEARNWSLQHSKADFVCWIDADEWIENPEAVNPTQWGDAKAILCPMHSEMPNGRIARHFLPKFFRNGTAHFEGIVHNQLIHGEPIGYTDIVFGHSGYNESAEIMAKKGERTIGLLRKQLADDPDNTFAMMNLARSLTNHGDINEVYPIIERALKLETEPTPLREMLLYSKIRYYYQIGALNPVKRTIDTALELNPHNLDFLFFLAQVAYEEQRWLDCLIAMGAYEAEQHRQRNGYADISNRLTDFWDAGALKHQLLGAAYFGLKRYDDAREAFRQALLIDTDDASLYKRYAYCCEQGGDTLAAEAAMSEMTDRGLV